MDYGHHLHEDHTSAPSSSATSSSSSSPISIGWLSPSSGSTRSVSSSSSFPSSSSSFLFDQTLSHTCAFPCWPTRSTLTSSRTTSSQDLYRSSRSSSSSATRSSSPSTSTSRAYPSPQPQQHFPSSYISDADLFPDELGEDGEVPYLSEAPAPPRVIPFYPSAAFVRDASPQRLQPLYAPERKKKSSSSSSSSSSSMNASGKRRAGSKQRSPLRKPMTPIAESPFAPEE